MKIGKNQLFIALMLVTAGAAWTSPMDPNSISVTMWQNHNVNVNAPGPAANPAADLPAPIAEPVAVKNDERSIGVARASANNVIQEPDSFTVTGILDVLVSVDVTRSRLAASSPEMHEFGALSKDLLELYLARLQSASSRPGLHPFSTVKPMSAERSKILARELAGAAVNRTGSAALLTALDARASIKEVLAALPAGSPERSEFEGLMSSVNKALKDMLRGGTPALKQMKTLTRESAAAVIEKPGLFTVHEIIDVLSYTAIMRDNAAEASPEYREFDALRSKVAEALHTCKPGLFAMTCGR